MNSSQLCEIFSSSFDGDEGGNVVLDVSDISQISSLQEKVATLEKALEQRNKEIKNLKIQVNELEDEQTDMKNAIEIKDKKYREVLIKLNKKQSLILELQSDLQENGNKEACFAEKYEQRFEGLMLKSDCKRLQECVSKLEHECQRVLEEVNRVIGKNQALEYDGKMWQRKRAKIEILLENALGKNKIIKKKNSELKDVIDQLEDQIKNINYPHDLSIDSDSGVTDNTMCMLFNDTNDII